MAKTDKIEIVPGKLSYSEQSIRNVQKSASAILEPDAIKYRTPHLTVAAKAYTTARDKLAEVFDELYDSLESLKVTMGEKEEPISFVELLDKGQPDITFKVFQSLPERAMQLISQGDLYSTTLKEHLIKNTLNEDGEQILSQKDFEKPDKGSKSSTKPAVTVTTDQDI